MVLVDVNCELNEPKDFKPFLLLKSFNLLTTFFIILRKKRSQLTYTHVYLTIKDLLIISAYEFSNLRLIHGFMTLSILTSALKFSFYFLNGFTHVNALHRFLRRFKAMLNYFNNFILSCTLIHSIKFLFCGNFVIIFVHAVDFGIIFGLKIKSWKIKFE